MPSPPLSRLPGLVACLVAAPTLSGLRSGDLGSAAAPLAGLALWLWTRAAWMGAVATVALSGFSASLGVALALAGAWFRRSPAWCLLAVAIALSVPPAGVDAAVLRDDVSRPVLGVALPVAGLLLVSRDRPVVVLLAALALGPWLGGHVGGPALAFGWIGLDHGWSGAAAVLAGLVGLAVTRLPPGRAALVVALLGIEGVWASLPSPAGSASSPPPLVRHLDERDGAVLVLPYQICGQPVPDPVRSDRWARWLAGAGRDAYGGCLAPDDPVLGEPIIAAIASVLHPEAPVFVPGGRPGRVFRSVGVTEVIVDRQAMGATPLAALDPVLARLLGPPQRDVAGQLDAYRVDPDGPRGRTDAPYLRPASGTPPPGWRTLDDLLGGAGRSGLPGTDVGKQ